MFICLYVYMFCVCVCLPASCIYLVHVRIRTNVFLFLFTYYYCIELWCIWRDSVRANIPRQGRMLIIPRRGNAENARQEKVRDASALSEGEVRERERERERNNKNKNLNMSSPTSQVKFFPPSPYSFRKQ
ncbi:hypothetical protein BDC45DRAFT_510652 [Circinella umbellata]|nr:hypothetical protein BDC45DRAFT_510652 [Circinella umbellata]